MKNNNYTANIGNIWYAVLKDREDNDCSYGSANLDTAKRMCIECGSEAFIAVMDDGDGFCIDEIEQSDF